MTEMYNNTQTSNSINLQVQTPVSQSQQVGQQVSEQVDKYHVEQEERRIGGRGEGGRGGQERKTTQRSTKRLEDRLVNELRLYHPQYDGEIRKMYIDRCKQYPYLLFASKRVSSNFKAWIYAQIAACCADQNDIIIHLSKSGLTVRSKIKLQLKPIHIFMPLTGKYKYDNIPRRLIHYYLYLFHLFMKTCYPTITFEYAYHLQLEGHYLSCIYYYNHNDTIIQDESNQTIDGNQNGQNIIDENLWTKWLSGTDYYKTDRIPMSDCLSVLKLIPWHMRHSIRVESVSADDRNTITSTPTPTPTLDSIDDQPISVQCQLDTIVINSTCSTDQEEEQNITTTHSCDSNDQEQITTVSCSSQDEVDISVINYPVVNEDSLNTTTISPSSQEVEDVEEIEEEKEQKEEIETAYVCDSDEIDVTIVVSCSQDQICVETCTDVVITCQQEELNITTIEYPSQQDELLTTTISEGISDATTTCQLDMNQEQYEVEPDITHVDQKQEEQQEEQKQEEEQQEEQQKEGQKEKQQYNVVIQHYCLYKDVSSIAKKDVITVVNGNSNGDEKEEQMTKVDYCSKEIMGQVAWLRCNPLSVFDDEGNCYSVTNTRVDCTIDRSKFHDEVETFSQQSIDDLSDNELAGCVSDGGHIFSYLDLLVHGKNPLTRADLTFTDTRLLSTPYLHGYQGSGSISLNVINNKLYCDTPAGIICLSDSLAGDSHISCETYMILTSLLSSGKLQNNNNVFKYDPLSYLNPHIINVFRQSWLHDQDLLLALYKVYSLLW